MEEVDSFGRTIVRDRDEFDGDSRRGAALEEAVKAWGSPTPAPVVVPVQVDRALPPPPARVHEERRGSFPPRSGGGGGGGGRGYNNGGGGHRGGGGGGGRGHHDWQPRNEFRDRDRGGGRGNRGFVHGRQTMQSGINPVMMSYKSFIQTLSDDLPPEQYVDRYVLYQQQFLRDFSDAFFERSKGDEWFQAWYNPIKHVEVEAENASKAAVESAMMRDELLADPEATLKAMELVGGAILQRLGVSGSSVPAPAAAPASTTGGDVPAATPTIADPRYFRGHLDCTLSFASIPAACTKALFVQAVTDALATIETPAQRIILGQPKWAIDTMTSVPRGTPLIPRHERGAWVVMSSPADAKKALRVLKELKVCLPGPLDELKGEQMVGIKVQTSASLLLPREHVMFLPEVFGSERRVAHDTTKAIELADKLDEARRVPAEQRLSALLLQCQGVASSSPTLRLDLAMSYLRRVHLVAYYQGRHFLDEGQMLAFCNGALQLRVPSSMPSAADQEGQQSRDAGANANASSDEVVAEVVGASEGDKDAGAATSTGEAEAAGTNDSTAVAVAVPVAAPAPKSGLEVHIDRWCDELLACVQAGEGRVCTAAQDHEDVQTILARQDQTLDAIMAQKCAVEAEGKARCCYPDCNKLFKGLEFLKKHIRGKHSEVFGLDALLADAVPFMKARFDAQEPGMRPLPPVEREVGNGEIEQKPIQELWNSLQQGGNKRGRDGGQGRGAGQGRGRDRDRGDQQRRERERERPAGGAQYVQPRSADNGNRERNSYMDVDQPKEFAKALHAEIDYGVAVLPPTKKRKVVLGGAPKV